MFQEEQKINEQTPQMQENIGETSAEVVGNIRVWGGVVRVEAGQLSSV